MKNYSNIALERAALGHLGVGLSQTGMTAKDLRALGQKVLSGQVTTPAIKQEVNTMEQKPYEARVLFGSNKDHSPGADKRLIAAMSHLTEVHGSGAEGRIRAMSGANLILLGEQVLRESATPTVNADRGEPYIPAKLFGG
jgi:hypothetical protein